MNGLDSSCLNTWSPVSGTVGERIREGGLGRGVSVGASLVNSRPVRDPVSKNKVDGT